MTAEYLSAIYNALNYIQYRLHDGALFNATEWEHTELLRPDDWISDRQSGNDTE